MLGALLPDVDASDAKVMHGYWRPIGLFGKYLFYKPMTWILKSKSEAFREEHRGYLHSLLGCLLATVFFAVPIAIIFIVLIYVGQAQFDLAVMIWYVLLGIPIGFILHLVEDSFTKSGVRWFFPRGKTYSGATRTGRRSEYTMMTAFLMSFGVLVIIAYYLPASTVFLGEILLASFVLLLVLYELNPLLSRFGERKK